MKKRIIILTIVVLIAAIIFAVFYIQKGKRTNTIRTTGIVEGIEVNLSPKISGRISEICCKEGDRVEKGQVVIKLESDDLRASVEEARAGVERAKADVMVAESAIENARANIQNAEAEIKTSEADVEKARAVMDEAKSKLEAWSSVPGGSFTTRRELELRNMLELSKLITEAAISRKGSVGAHYRSDYPERGDRWERHITFKKEKERLKCELIT